MESFSVSTMVATLSRPAPPYCSGIPPLSKPSSPAFFTSSGMRPGFLFSNSFTSGRTSLTTNSSAVWPISFWSSVRSAGVKTSSGRGVSRRKLPPLAAGLVIVAVAIMVSLSRCASLRITPELGSLALVAAQLKVDNVRKLGEQGILLPCPSQVNSVEWPDLGSGEGPSAISMALCQIDNNIGLDKIIGLLETAPVSTRGVVKDHAHPSQRRLENPRHPPSASLWGHCGLQPRPRARARPSRNTPPSPTAAEDSRRLARARFGHGRRQAHEAPETNCELPRPRTRSSALPGPRRSPAPPPSLRTVLRSHSAWLRLVARTARQTRRGPRPDRRHFFSEVLARPGLEAAI